MNDIVLSVLGVLIGGLITLIVSRKYYERASSELVRETAQLRALHVLTLRALECGGVAEFGKDDQGLPVGLQHRLQAEARTCATATADLSVARPDSSAKANVAVGVVEDQPTPTR